MFKKSKLLVCTLVLAMGLTGFAIPAGAASVTAAPTHSVSAVHHSKCNHMHGGHTMGLLSEITGKVSRRLQANIRSKPHGRLQSRWASSTISKKPILHGQKLKSTVLLIIKR